MRKLTLLHVLFFATVSFAQNTVRGEDLINQNRIKILNTKSEFSNIEKSLDEEGNLQFLIETTKEPRFIYNSATSIPIHTKAYKKGRVFLLSFQAKTVSASLETGEAKALFIFKQLKNHKGNIDYTQSFSSEWQTYHLPFEAYIDIKKEDLAVVMQFGFRPQSFQIKDIKFEVFQEGTALKSLPKTDITYAGIEADAQWRKDAKKRIEANRKGNFTVQFIKKGQPLADRAINLKLINHSFQFGARMAAKDIVKNTDDYKNFKKMFNSLVLGNDLKIKSWSRNDRRRETLKALKILKKDGYPVKGHVLIWPGFNFLTKDIKRQKDNPEKVKQLVEDHINDILKRTKGKVTHWDVVNEAYTNRDLQNITGSEEILYNGFRTIAKQQPNIRRFTNEYGIISKGGIDTQKQQWYYDFIKRIDENTDGLVQGIGIQSHIGSDLTPPKRVLEILSFYATLGKEISISEFTMDVQDELVREQYTRDFMIAAFSHPNVSEFLFWGNTEDGRKKSDIFTVDNELGVMGKAYYSLVFRTWRTNLSGTTSKDGLVVGRGFYGTYEYSIVENGKVVTGTFELKPDELKMIRIEL